jgi:hypothetical protein
MTARDGTAASFAPSSVRRIDAPPFTLGGTAATTGDSLWTQQQAAAALKVSPRYLRESSCPKVLLPGNGEKGQPLVRYDPAEVREWREQWTASHLTRARA